MMLWRQGAGKVWLLRLQEGNAGHTKQSKALGATEGAAEDKAEPPKAGCLGWGGCK